MKRLFPTVLAIALSAAATSAAHGQLVFRSTTAVNLPTAAMLNPGNWMFEISHRFERFSTGASGGFGLDGAARIRLGLTHQPHERVMVGIMRSNHMDNVELNTRFRAVTSGGSVPIQIAVQGGIAWNTEVFPVEGAEDNEMQAYAQLVANARLGDRLSVGVVPAFLHNPRLRDVESGSAVEIGVNGQLYLGGAFALIGEWIFSEAHPELPNDSGAFGLEIQTRGHFFKLIVTNQYQLSPTQVLGGSAYDFADPDDWRFGFNITRLLPF